ncbi:MAG: hypothetical protein PHV61_11130 [Limnochordia bacterium]|nr:hypothetical protein [Limnochordia bacterium]
MGNEHRLYTFIDNGIIDSVQCIKRCVNQPEKSPANPLITKDQPWETIPYLTCNTWNVIHDPKENLFKCWYEDWGLDFHMLNRCRRRLLFDENGRAITSWLDPRVSQIRVLYAESVDGLKWEKPVTNTVGENAGTNTVAGSPSLGNVHAAYVFLDPLEQDGERRFKMMYSTYGSNEENSHGIISLAHSSDGRKWTPYHTHPVFGESGSRLGDVWTIFYDYEIGKYIMPTRHTNMHSHGALGRKPASPTLPVFFSPYYPGDPLRMNKRRIFLCISDNLFQWNEPQEIIVPDDARDNLDECFYGMQITRLGDVYLGFVHKLSKVDNTMEVYLAHSRNAIDWEFVVPRIPFLTTGLPGSWDQFMVNMPSHPINTEKETLLYYGGASCHHDWWIEGRAGVEDLQVPEAWNANLARFGVGLARIGRDRYVALEARSRQGLVVTRPLTVSRRKLCINAQCQKGGLIKIALAGEDYQVLPGYHQDRCLGFCGDDMHWQMSWQGKEDIDYVGPARLFIYMQNARIYSIWFE